MTKRSECDTPLNFLIPSSRIVTLDIGTYGTIPIGQVSRVQFLNLNASIPIYVTQQAPKISNG